MARRLTAKPVQDGGRRLNPSGVAGPGQAGTAAIVPGRSALVCAVQAVQRCGDVRVGLVPPPVSGDDVARRHIARNRGREPQNVWNC